MVFRTRSPSSRARSRLDLRAKPFSRDQKAWCNHDDYSACQALARSARAAETRIVRYESVRDPERGVAQRSSIAAHSAAMAACDGRQTWFLTVDRQRASWVRAGGAPGTDARIRVLDGFRLAPKRKALFVCARMPNQHQRRSERMEHKQTIVLRKDLNMRKGRWLRKERTHRCVPSSILGIKTPKIS